MLAELLLVVFSGMTWILRPELGLWFTLVALLPAGVRLAAGMRPFKRTPFDWLILIFLITAWIGYWAAYDKTTAWIKVWMIVTAVLFYYALRAQPRENLIWVSCIFFCFGVGISLYFFLTHDFISLPRKLEFVNSIGRWVMGNRPQFGWMPIHPNYVAGLIAITVPFGFYPAWKLISGNITSCKCVTPGNYCPWDSACLFLRFLWLLLAALFWLSSVGRGPGCYGKS